jgi:hypothetical protein
MLKEKIKKKLNLFFLKYKALLKGTMLYREDNNGFSFSVSLC